MIIACYLATAVFAQFTYWQFNDLEQYGTQFWYGWVAAYGSVALVSLISARRALPRALYLAGAGTAFAASIVRMRSIEWGGTIFYNETNPAGNETGGLAIVGLWLSLLAIRRVTADSETNA
ncbi:MAG: hypothetical protein JRG84_18415 [Deltaproteobacteria bacterium]|nr:hypothetical protein [Deltaproteobacteria bacterium]